MEERIYKPLEYYTLEEANYILEHGTWNELMRLPFSVGEYCEKWKEAQNICIRLFENEDAAVRANAALGLSYIARTRGILEKGIVKPYLLKELRENEEYRWRIIDSIKEINLWLDWHMAEHAMEKFE